jgi:hypothetical protein
MIHTEFGSKKKKRAMRAAQSNTILSENISGFSAVESAVSEHFEEFEATTVLMNAADEALEQNRQALLPKYNLAAESADEAYPIDAIISHEMLTSIKKFMEHHGTGSDVVDTMEGLIINEGEESAITIMGRLSNMKPNTALSDSSSSDSKRWKKYRRSLERLYVYLMMIKFYLLITNQMHNTILRSELESKLSLPDSLLSHLVDTFTSSRRQHGKTGYSASKMQL